MKRDNKIQLIILLLTLFFFESCSKGFLIDDPKGKKLETNYFKTSEELYSGLIAAYSVLSREISDRSSSWYNSKLVPLNAASDECYAGGGNSSDQPAWQAMSNYKTLTPTVGPQSGFWGNNFDGIYRSNLVIEKAQENIADLTDANRSRFVAEAKFLRAYFYFELVRLFKNVPLILGPISADKWYTIAQVPAGETYAQIEKDLKESITILPEVLPTTENGRATRGAAMALLGKVILFQNKEDRMYEAAEYFEKVSGSGHYQLLTKYGEIFDPTHKFNAESILEIPHTNAQNATWEHGYILGNIYPTIIGPRAYSGPIYFSGGYGFNPIIEKFALEMKGDPRYPYTIANIDSLVKNNVGASYSQGYQNSGYFIQKFAPLKKFESTTGIAEINWPNNYIEIRLADVYLMAAEALLRSGRPTVGSHSAQWFLDQVRKRVNLVSIPATLDNIYQERKLELATEGHRWYDLVRTGKAKGALAFKGFELNKNEILPIPLNELNNTKIKQNPNY
ncbi:RagB/SusD family nutrient uptake outer membrane protein [Sphingobacterium thalpophilum]|uniref:RagB/SusD family nutrient uptake outer membrane protein n=1 Tax=Sphingobacterium thalpophilum TaxID=259 RepID=A0ACD5C340_9SPHI